MTMIVTIKKIRGIANSIVKASPSISVNLTLIDRIKYGIRLNAKDFSFENEFGVLFECHHSKSRQTSRKFDELIAYNPWVIR